MQNIDQSISTIYRLILDRDPDAGGLANYRQKILSGKTNFRDLVGEFFASAEFQNNFPISDQNISLHMSRCQFVRFMPRAKKILDLGGSSQGDERGALVVMGYPYAFEELTIVELPASESHSLYQQNKHLNVVKTDKGPVRYAYHSMLDLGRYQNASFDMIVNGQAIEHVDENSGDHMLREIHRILRPGGILAIDTPNGRVCRMQQSSMINDDHKIEYTHAQLSEKLGRAGFVIESAIGLNYCGPSTEKGVFNHHEMKKNFGLYSDIDNSYLLAYICRRPH